MGWHGTLPNVPGPDVNRDAWLAYRRNGIGASEVAAILGCGIGDSSPAEVWAVKKGLHEVAVNEAMWWGTRDEQNILDRYELETGRKVPVRGVVVEHPEHSWAFATVDGLDIPEKDGETWVSDAEFVVEAKSTARGWDGIPVAYRVQAQWQMFVTGLSVVRLAVRQGHTFDLHEVEADAEDQTAFFEAVVEFREEYLLKDVRPSVVGASSATVAALYPTSEAGKAVEVDGELVQLARKLKEDIKAGEKQLAEVIGQLKDQMGDAEVGLVDGDKEITWKPQRSSSVDVAEMKATRPDLYGEWLRTKAIRVFRT